MLGAFVFAPASSTRSQIEIYMGRCARRASRCASIVPALERAISGPTKAQVLEKDRKSKLLPETTSFALLRGTDVLIRAELGPEALRALNDFGYFQEAVLRADRLPVATGRPRPQDAWWSSWLRLRTRSTLVANLPTRSW